MQLPLQITFHNTPRSPEIEDMVREAATRLDNFAERIMSCRAVIDVPHKHHEHGNMYQVRLDIKVPGGEIAVTREPAEHVAFRDLPTAIGHAFDAAVRQLEDVVRKQRIAVKHHEPLPHARVARLFHEAGYGFLQTPDGREVYFHANSVLTPTFDTLEIGTEVTFVEELGDKGPQASTIHAVGRRHHE